MTPAPVSRPAAVAALLVLAAAAALPQKPAVADLPAKARQVQEAHAASVVRVTATVKQDMAGFGIQLGGAGSESTVDAIGTVVDPSGIVVVPRGQLNPMGMMMGDGMEVNIGGERRKIEMKTELSRPVIHLADGTEVPARIALEDPDGGLTYLAPEQPLAKPLASVPAEAAAEPKPLDDMILVSRLPKTYGNEPAVTLARVKAVVTKPRRGYVPEGGEMGAAFDQEGRFVGVATLRMPSMKDLQRGTSPVILIIPAADIATVARQVREGAAEKPATP
jgi:hypothetical protein